MLSRMMRWCSNRCHHCMRCNWSSRSWSSYRPHSSRNLRPHHRTFCPRHNWYTHSPLCQTTSPRRSWSTLMPTHSTKCPRRNFRSSKLCRLSACPRHSRSTQKRGCSRRCRRCKLSSSPRGPRCTYHCCTMSMWWPWMRPRYDRLRCIRGMRRPGPSERSSRSGTPRTTWR